MRKKDNRIVVTQDAEQTKGTLEQTILAPEQTAELEYRLSSILK
jgi:DNA topoisomerase IA